jgi:hypothetical protein
VKLAFSLVTAGLLLMSAGCGLDTSANFNADGSVTIGLRFMIPKSAAAPGSGINVTGLSPSDLASSQAKLQKLYPGAMVTRVTEGDETGALATIPFKTEKDAFAFLTQPSKLSAPSASSGAAMGLNLSDTGGLFKTATHTTSGGSDTYAFTTQPPPTPSPTPGAQTIPGGDALLSIFVITFALTVPHVITSAPGALFTLDRKTAIWKLSLTSPQTLTATTGTDTSLVASVAPAQDPRLLVALAFIALALGFLLGGFLPWRSLISRPTAKHATASSAPTPPADPVAWPGPPPEAPPPTKL